MNNLRFMIHDSRFKGFTLVELLVVMAIMAIFGTLILTIFTNTLKGSNKSQVVGIIKQNGQAVLETIDKTVRNADKVVCPSIPASATSASSDTLMVVKNGVYTRYRFVSAVGVNGSIQQDNPTKELAGVNPVTGIDWDLSTDPDFINKLCADLDPLLDPISLTDTNVQSGVSVNCHVDDCVNNPVFKREKTSGFMDQVTINFDLKPGVGAPASVTGQIDTTNFQTTIQLR